MIDWIWIPITVFAALCQCMRTAVQKFLKEVTLLSQPFVKDDKKTVQQLLKDHGASVAGFTLFIVGEGIEKKQSDFAAEVAAQAAAASSR